MHRLFQPSNTNVTLKQYVREYLSPVITDDNEGNYL